MKKKSTYRLLVQSEEKSRNLLETALYALFAISALAAIWQFADEPTLVPSPQSNTVLEQAQVDRFAS
jgi:hypothetical protein